MNAMSAHTSIRTGTFPVVDAGKAIPLNQLWNVAITVSVGADRARIFQVLTVPEYVEAWFCLPGAGSNELVATAVPPNGYRIEQHGRGGPDISIFGSYRVLRRSKLIFTWIRNVWPPAQSSLVWLRLLGDFSRTTVQVDHLALPSREEYLWHHTLWETSLKRLCSLFESCHSC